MQFMTGSSFGQCFTRSVILLEHFLSPHHSMSYRLVNQLSNAFNRYCWRLNHQQILAAKKCFQIWPKRLKSKPGWSRINPWAPAGNISLHFLLKRCYLRLLRWMSRSTINASYRTLRTPNERFHASHAVKAEGDKHLGKASGRSVDL